MGRIAWLYAIKAWDMIMVYPYENEKLVEEIKPLKGGYKHDAILPEGLAPIPGRG